MKLSNLAAQLRKYGLTVVEVDGAANRGYAGQDMQELLGVLWHHTATPRSNYLLSDAPTLNMCINGRSDLPGPLCQLVLGRSGTVYFIAAGVGNHAGTGGGFGVPRDMGNHHLVGIEMESSGIAPWDWTDDQLRVAPYLGAALALILWPEGDHVQLAHAEYSDGGKIDPAGWPGGMDGFRASINAKIAELEKGTTPAPAPTPAKPAPAPAPGGKFVPDPHWLVEKTTPAETMSQIAKWAGVSVAALAKFNGIKDPNKITVGERIWSPAGAIDTWMVDPGDTLSKIAAFYNGQTSVAKLQDANGINNPNTDLKVGMRLIIR